MSGRLLPILLVVSVGGACGRGERPAPDSATQGSDVRTTPVFEVELWPGEGTPVITAVRDDLELLRSPSPEAANAGSLRVRTGARISYDSTRVQTMAPAMVTVTDSSSLRGRFLGDLRLLSRDRYYSDAFRDTTISLTPSERFEYLQPRAEGSCFVRIDGSVVEANPCPTHDSTSFRVSGEPELRWWILVSGGSARGWLLVSDSTAKVVRRDF
jgi:hypothetical protein